MGFPSALKLPAMQRLRIALGFFPHLPVWRWPGLALYLFGWALYQASGLRLFGERVLRFRDFAVVADVEGRGGLFFLHEILVEDIYDFPPIGQGEAVRVMFDIGANCGFFALTRCARDPDLRAVAFEPQPHTFERLKKNLAANQFGPRVTAVHAAVGAASGECTLQISAESSMGIVSTSAVQFLEAPVAVTVPMVALDDFAAREDLWPDLLKIDVEGFEVEVLKGAAACLQRARFVVLECHSESLTRECQDLLAAADFQTSLRGGLLFGQKTPAKA